MIDSKYYLDLNSTCVKLFYMQTGTLQFHERHPSYIVDVYKSSTYNNYPGNSMNDPK